MIEREQFRKVLIIEPTAASIGINKDDWYCFKNGMTSEEVRQTMIAKKYDVVPILDKNGVLKQYFTLNQNDPTKLTSTIIASADTLYYMTHVRDLVTIMRRSSKTHFFLTNHRETNEIVGLVSLSNFNCRDFYTFLFSLISYVEKEFAQLVCSSEHEAFQILEHLSSSKELVDQLNGIKQRLKEDRENNIENDYKEYLYIHHLTWLVRAEGNYKLLKYQNTEDFESGSGRIRDIRNTIAHPVKSLVKNIKDLDTLEVAILKLYEYKERLESFLIQPTTTAQ